MGPAITDNLFRIDIKTYSKGTEAEPGNGLGLLLCKEYIEKQGGKI
jgi:two-component system, sensor histidine kinase and response regulator